VIQQLLGLCHCLLPDSQRLPFWHGQQRHELKASAIRVWRSCILLLPDGLRLGFLHGQNGLITPFIRMSMGCPLDSNGYYRITAFFQVINECIGGPHLHGQGHLIIITPFMRISAGCPLDGNGYYRATVFCQVISQSMGLICKGKIF
jgi:hypothetical protein